MTILFNEIVPENSPHPHKVVVCKEQFSVFWAGHVHDFVEIVIPKKGYGIHKIGNQSIDLSNNDLFIILPGVFHDFQNTTQCEVLNISIETRTIQHDLFDVFSEPRINWILTNGSRKNGGFLHIKAPDSVFLRIIQTVEEIFKEGEDRLECRTCILARCKAGPEFTYAQQRQLALLRLVLLELAPLVPWPERSLSPPIENTIQAMLSELGRDWSIESLASIACLEPTYFTRLFKKQTGESPMEYLMQARVQRAASLLKSRSALMKEVYLSCGFKDYSHFYKRFKHVYRISPKEFFDRNTFSRS